MKDLQELFETMPTAEFTKISELVDKKSVNPNNVKKVLDYVAQVYCAEMYIDEAELNEEQMQKLLDDFTLALILYSGVLKGDMAIKSGRIKLTDGNSAKFSLTTQGINHCGIR